MNSGDDCGLYFCSDTTHIYILISNGKSDRSSCKSEQGIPNPEQTMSSDGEAVVYFVAQR